MRNAGFEFDAIDYAKKPLDAETVKSLVAAAGGVAPLLNTRHATVKEKGWVTSPPDADTFAKAVVKDVNVLKRPLLMVGKKLIVGFDKPAYAKLK